MTLSILGAGGHAKVVLEAAQAMGLDIAGVFDDGRQGSLLGHEILGRLDDAEGQAVIAIGRNDARRDIAQRLERRWTAIIHPASAVSPSARVGSGAVVFAGAVVQADTVVGAHAIINTAASVDHDCQIGDFAHIGPGAHLCGNVTVGEGTLIGVGASVSPGVRIGAWATIGAGAAVVRDVEDRTVVAGVPARPM